MQKSILNLAIVLPALWMAVVHDAHANSVNDVVRNKSIACDKNNANTGAKAFDKFPNIWQCNYYGAPQWAHHWGNSNPGWCSGYSATYYDDSTMMPDARNQTLGATDSCWAYVCKAGNVMYQNQCIPSAQCSQMAGYMLSKDNTQCITSNWCSDAMKNAYAAAPQMYTQSCSVEQKDVGIFIKKTICPACMNLKCITGYCMNSATDMTCAPTDAAGKLGGKYADATTNVCKSCDQTSFVNDTGDGCVPAQQITKTQMKACFACGTDRDKFKACVTASNPADYVNTNCGGTGGAQVN
ncbi:MAG: hypothetical protein FWC51_00785 [Proteobacteria bacterium]|nr:hypothetical protein [Pseudomonadota bacterium]